MNLKEEQERIMKKYGMTNWKYISIATKSETTRKRLLELGFVEPIKKASGMREVVGIYTTQQKAKKIL